MKLLRYGPSGQEKPGSLDKDGNVRDLSKIITDLSGEALAPSELHRIAQVEDTNLPIVPGVPQEDLR